MTFSGMKYFVPIVMSQRRWQRLPLHLVRSPAHSGSALNCGRENIGKTHSLLHFMPQTHQKTATVVSAGYIFRGRNSHKPQKAKRNVIAQESEKYQKVCVLWQKSSVSTNKCGAQTCFLIEKADGPNADGKTGSGDCGKQSIRGHHFSRSDRETGSGVGTHNTQKEITIVAAVRHTDRVIHKKKLYWVPGGECCLSTSSSLLCLSSALSLIASGFKPPPPQPETPNAKRYWSKHIYYEMNTAESLEAIFGLIIM